MLNVLGSGNHVSLPVVLDLFSGIDLTAIRSFGACEGQYVEIPILL